MTTYDTTLPSAFNADDDSLSRIKWLSCLEDFFGLTISPVRTSHGDTMKAEQSRKKVGFPVRL